MNDAPLRTEDVPVILPWDQLQKLAERDGLDIMVYVNSMNAHIEHQRAALRRQAEQIEKLRRGEFICKKCGLRKDAEKVHADF
jgi:hypothetical protein